MLSCLLCLRKKSMQIKINSKKGKALQCSAIIAKHFWLKPNAKNDSTESVCLACWDVLLAFHQLYQTVVEAHNYLENQLTAMNFNNADVLIKPKEEHQVFKLDGALFMPEVKVELTDLELLPHTEVIEDAIDNNEDTQRELKSNEGDTSLQQASDKHINQEFSCNFSDNDSNIDYDDYPLSMLLQATSKQGRNKLQKSSTMKRKNKLEPLENMKSTKSTVITESLSSPVIDILKHAKCPSDNDENDSTITISDKNVYSDYEPSEDDASVGDKLRQTMKKRATVKKIELDKNISKYFENLPCSKCELLLEDFDALMQHSQTTHNSKPAIKCCGRIFKMRRPLSKHVLTHLKPKDFTCTLCDSIFNNNTLLEKHMEINHRCSECSKVFPNKQNLREHITVRHLQKSEYKFVCPECREHFPLKRRLWEHLNIVHNHSPIICDKCGKRMRSPFAFKRHMISKHSVQSNPETERVQCDECGKWLKHQNSLRCHKYIVHEERSQQQCSICHKIMPSVRALERHIIHNHQKERKFKCPMCDRAFRDNRDLQQHINLHTKALVYNCDLCEKTFYQTSSLHKHKSVYHPNNQLEVPDPVQCQICSAWLKTLPGLKRHIKVLHEGAGEHRCHICNNVSVNAIALKRHIKRNHGIKIDNKTKLNINQQNNSETAEI